MSVASAWLSAISTATASLKDQWMRSGLLRVGTLAVLIIVVSEALLALRQRTQALHTEAAELSTTLSAQRALLRQSAWSTRKLESQRQVQALETMIWQAPDAALAQAGLLDWVRATAIRSGLNVREAVASRQFSAGGSAAAEAPVAQPPTASIAPSFTAAPSIDVGALQKDGFTLWRVRLNLEFKRAPLLVFLQELYAHPKVVMVDRLDLRLGASGSVVEIDLRAVSTTGTGTGQQP